MTDLYRVPAIIQLAGDPEPDLSQLNDPVTLPVLFITRTPRLGAEQAGRIDKVQFVTRDGPGDEAAKLGVKIEVTNFARGVPTD